MDRSSWIGVRGSEFVDQSSWIRVRGRAIGVADMDRYWSFWTDITCFWPISVDFGRRAPQKKEKTMNLTLSESKRVHGRRAGELYLPKMWECEAEECILRRSTSNNGTTKSVQAMHSALSAPAIADELVDSDEGQFKFYHASHRNVWVDEIQILCHRRYSCY